MSLFPFSRKQPKTRADLLALGREKLNNKPDAVLAAELLLCRVLVISKEGLHAHPETMTTAKNTNDYTDLVIKYSQDTPLAYLLGEKEFYGRTFETTPNVLIPRPETELLVEEMVATVSNLEIDEPVIADIGTGSGAVGITLALEIPSSRVYATDISAKALSVAKDNAQRLGAKGLTFLKGDLCQPLPEKVDIIVANLPYLTEEEYKRGPEYYGNDIKHEPRAALVGGRDGMELFRKFFKQAPAYLRENGTILLEIGAGQDRAVTEMAQKAFPQAKVSTKKDLSGLDRVVTIQS